MPDAPDVRRTSHDRHDTMLVAAFAADDLAGTERDQAIALTRTCPECATLHTDLVAIARATATLPPPIAPSGLDFRLSPRQAARLRRTGWRAFIPSVSPGSVLTRPLGVGLATFGLIGLLVGNLGFGSQASGPALFGASGGATSGPADSLSRDIQGESSTEGQGAAVPAASAAAAASVAPGTQYLAASPAASSDTALAPVPVADSHQPSVAGL